MVSRSPLLSPVTMLCIMVSLHPPPSFLPSSLQSRKIAFLLCVEEPRSQRCLDSSCLSAFLTDGWTDATTRFPFSSPKYVITIKLGTSAYDFLLPRRWLRNMGASPAAEQVKEGEGGGRLNIPRHAQTVSGLLLLLLLHFWFPYRIHQRQEATSKFRCL